MAVDLSGQRLAFYQLRDVLGRGGMSVVYRAVDTRLDRPVALKVMSENLSADAEFRGRFIAEAKAASAIDHVNVVPLYDFGEADGWLYIAMRLVDGTDLAQELAVGPMPTRRVFSVLGQVGAALDMLHERGLVHLDVKPANVLITRNESVGTDHVYLADFGLTRRDATGHRTASGDFLGSPSFAAPEHLRGEPVLPSADLYSLTCVLFTALAGRSPFVGDVRTVITGHLSGSVPSLTALTGLPPAIDRVIARGMANDPAARYPTSSELLAAARRAMLAPLQPLRPVPGVLPMVGPDPGVTGVPAAGSSHPVAGTSISDRSGSLGRAGLHGRSESLSRAGPPAAPSPPDPPPWPVTAQRAAAPAGPPPRRNTVWIWLTVVGFLVVAGVVALVIVLSGAGDPVPSPTTPSSSESTAPTSPETTAPIAGSIVPPPSIQTSSAPSLILPSNLLPSRSPGVTGLPDPFTSTG